MKLTGADAGADIFNVCNIDNVRQLRLNLCTVLSIADHNHKLFSTQHNNCWKPLEICWPQNTKHPPKNLQELQPQNPNPKGTDSTEGYENRTYDKCART